MGVTESYQPTILFMYPFASQEYLDRLRPNVRNIVDNLENFPNLLSIRSKEAASALGVMDPDEANLLINCIAYQTRERVVPFLKAGR
jgi:hypothetical protein